MCIFPDHFLNSICNYVIYLIDTYTVHSISVYFLLLLCEIRLVSNKEPEIYLLEQILDRICSYRRNNNKNVIVSTICNYLVTIIISNGVNIIHQFSSCH